MKPLIKLVTMGKINFPLPVLIIMLAKISFTRVSFGSQKIQMVWEKKKTLYGLAEHPKESSP